MAKIISVSEARARLAEITDDVAFNGAEYILTKNDKEVARISSSSSQDSLTEEVMGYVKDFADAHNEDFEELAQL